MTIPIYFIVVILYLFGSQFIVFLSFYFEGEVVHITGSFIWTEISLFRKTNDLTNLVNKTFVKKVFFIFLLISKAEISNSIAVGLTSIRALVCVTCFWYNAEVLYIKLRHSSCASGNFTKLNVQVI